MQVSPLPFVFIVPASLVGIGGPSAIGSALTLSGISYLESRWMLPGAGFVGSRVSGQAAEAEAVTFVHAEVSKGSHKLVGTQGSLSLPREVLLASPLGQCKASFLWQGDVAHRSIRHHCSTKGCSFYTLRVSVGSRGSIFKKDLPLVSNMGHFVDKFKACTELNRPASRISPSISGLCHRHPGAEGDTVGLTARRAWSAALIVFPMAKGTSPWDVVEPVEP